LASVRADLFSGRRPPEYAVASEPWGTFALRPGDVIGLVGHDAFGIGDTLTEDRTIAYDEIPRFPPEVFAYSLFMQAMGQRGGMDRHTAVKTFTEVLDYFPDEVWIAAPALFFRGRTHLDIGDERKALADFNRMIDHPKYQSHALAAWAMNRVADSLWAEDKRPQALGMWRRVMEGFGKSNGDQARAAESRLYDWQVVQGEIDAALAQRIAWDTRRKPAERELPATRELFESAIQDIHGKYREWYFLRFHEEKKAARMQEELRLKYYEWYKGKQEAFAAGGMEWDFLLSLFSYAGRHDQSRIEELLVRIGRFLRQAEMSPAQRGSRAKTLIEALANLKRYPEAESLLEFIPEPADRFWTLTELLQRQEKFKDALKVLDQIEALKLPEETLKAKRMRAEIHHKRLQEYDIAIKLYHEINEPPETLWSITDCYRRSGRRQQAQDTLTEIASIFPQEASKAVFAKAEYFRQDGEKNQAIGLYRNLLSHPDWKKTGEASSAHDRLEELGIATGGAVIHEIN
jgi:tetratricopeptide (TPR) repeat protein